MADMSEVIRLPVLRTIGTHQVFPFGPPDARLKVGFFLRKNHNKNKRGKQMRILGHALQVDFVTEVVQRN